MKHTIDDIDNSLLSVKHFHGNTTCLLDLPSELFLLICRYLSPTYVLHSFYTPEKAELRFHRIIVDYYKKIQLDKITFDEYSYLHKLLCYSNNCLQPDSLRLSNEHVTCLIHRYFYYKILPNGIQSIFVHLKRLTLINCSANEISSLDNEYINHLTQLEYLHINLRKFKKQDFSKFNKIISSLTIQQLFFYLDYRQNCDGSIGRILFNKKLLNLDTVNIEIPDGLSLYQSLVSHENIRHLNIILQTIDDLYILINKLIPNIQSLIVQLSQTRILTCLPPPCKSPCLQLTEFTLLEPRIGLVISDIKSLLNYMPSLNKLTLSIRDTPDPLFCHGPSFESILSEYLPHLRQFVYTMTHRIIDQALIEDFLRWPMNSMFYENENCQWIHIYSLPWPVNKDDKRRLPILNGGCHKSVGSDVKRVEYIDHVMITNSNQLIQLKTSFRRASQLTSCLSIDIKLPERISKLILTKETHVSSMNSIVQPHIRHLIVERRLIDEEEIRFLAHQYPNVKYLQLLFPLDKSSFVRCFQSLFSIDDVNHNRRFWSSLINFCTTFVYTQSDAIITDADLHRWLIENTDLKYRHLMFYANCSESIFSIWL